MGKMQGRKSTLARRCYAKLQSLYHAPDCHYPVYPGNLAPLHKSRSGLPGQSPAMTTLKTKNTSATRAKP